jgi:hypothetical protein
LDGPRLRSEDNIKMDIGKYGRCVLYSSVSGQGPVVASFVHGDEPRFSMKDGEFLD